MAKLRPGMNVAVAVGSRGIRNLKMITIGGGIILAMTDAPIEKLLPLFVQAGIVVAFLAPNPRLNRRKRHGSVMMSCIKLQCVLSDAVKKFGMELFNTDQ